jgi:hypothetical protein
MVILKATSFLEGHKRDMGMTFRITPQGHVFYPQIKNKEKKNFFSFFLMFF